MIAKTGAQKQDSDQNPQGRFHGAAGKYCRASTLRRVLGWVWIPSNRRRANTTRPTHNTVRALRTLFPADAAGNVRTQTSPILYTKMRILSTGICPSHQSLFNLIIFPWRSSLWTDILLILTSATIGSLRLRYRTDCPAQTTAPVLCVSTGYTFSFPPVSREGNFQ